MSVTLLSPVNVVCDFVGLSHVLSLHRVENILSALALLVGRVKELSKWSKGD